MGGNLSYSNFSILSNQSYGKTPFLLANSNCFPLNLSSKFLNLFLGKFLAYVDNPLFINFKLSTNLNLK